MGAHVFRRTIVVSAVTFALQRQTPAPLKGLSQAQGGVHPIVSPSADDKQEVERWIDEMEKLRAQNATVPAAPLPTAESPRGRGAGGWRESQQQTPR